MAARLRLFASFWLYPLLGLLLAAITGIPDAPGSGWAFPLWIGVGVAGWTLIEYGLHRFVFHPGARLSVLKATAYRMHGRHHQNPRNPKDILVTPEFSLVTSAVIFGLLWLGPMDAASAAAVLMGVWIGFLYYEWVHYRVHTTNASGLLDWHRRRHFYHHFVNENSCYGVTSPVWDIVFGTRKPPSSADARFPR